MCLQQMPHLVWEVKGSEGVGEAGMVGRWGT